MRTAQLTVRLSADRVREDGTFTGYASTFGTVNAYNEYVARGAYSESLEKLAGKPLPLLWQHEDDKPVGTLTELKEDDTGLYVTGRLFVADVQLAREAYALIAGGAVTGLSVGAWAEDFTVSKEPDVPTALTKLTLREVSIVTFPADDAARIDAVMAEKIPNPRELEHALCDAGCSRRVARRFAGEICRASSRETRCDAGTLEQISTIINAVNLI